MFTNTARTWGARILEPIAGLMARLHITANQATIFGFLLTCGISLVIASGRLQLAGWLLIGALAFDAVDGTLARMTNSVSLYGAFLDSTMDRWAEIVLYFGLAWYFTQTGQSNAVLLAMAALSTSLMVSYTRARAEGIRIPLKEGAFTRFERLVVLVIGLIFNWVIWPLIIITVLSGLTAIQRMIATRRLASPTP